MAVSKPPKRGQSLSKGRPPNTKQSRSMSRKASRTLINSHHTLQKRRAQAVARGDATTVTEIDAQISAMGGLGLYQEASLQGQRKDRGGDTSILLLEWLRQSHQSFGSSPRSPREGQLKMLEVGALSSKNACSLSGLFDMELIDLNSQEPTIVQQDFLKRPLPNDDSERFDIISLSLVLNYVPDVNDRGDMLRRTALFLRHQNLISPDPDSASNPVFPCLFLVLPRSCLTNSRYFSAERLDELMKLLGFEKLNSKFTGKLAYSLWTRQEIAEPARFLFSKTEVNPGRTRNNFAVVMR